MANANYYGFYFSYDTVGSCLSAVDTVSNHRYCGTDSCDAAYKCATPCPGGTDDECPGDETCFDDTPCTTYSVPPTFEFAYCTLHNHSWPVFVTVIIAIWSYMFHDFLAMTKPQVELRKQTQQRMTCAGNRVEMMQTAATNSSVFRVYHHVMLRTFRGVLTSSVEVTFVTPHLDARHLVHQ